jgi:hypothetical protein
MPEPSRNGALKKPMLEMHDNATSREAKPGLWIFTGRFLILLVASAAAFIAIFQSLNAFGFDLITSLVISLLPALVSALFVAMIRGKPPSYSTDVLLLWVWRMKTWMHQAGMKERASLLWIEDRAETHPKEF